MRPFRICSFLLSALLITSSAWSQATTSLRGTVTDAQGGVIGGVALQLVGEQTGFKRSVLSDEAGSYQFVQVPPGAYILVAEKPRFAVVTQTGVSRLVNTPATLDVKREVATGSETVSVEGEATKINTTDATFSVLLELNDALIRLNEKLERVSLRDLTLVPRTSVIPQRTTDIKPTITK